MFVDCPHCKYENYTMITETHDKKCCYCKTDFEVWIKYIPMAKAKIIKTHICSECGDEFREYRTQKNSICYACKNRITKAS